MFGLTRVELLDRFYAMEPKSSETQAQYALRVESRRMVVGASNEQTYTSFVYRLGAELLAELEPVRRAKRALKQDFGWPDVVQHCRDKALGSQLTRRTTPAQPNVATNVATTPQSLSTDVAGSGGPRAPAGGARKETCDLCEQLGCPANHARRWCYIDPDGKLFSRDMLEKRVAHADRLGKNVPKRLRDELAKARTGADLHWLQGMQSALHSLTGEYSPGEREELLGHVLDTQAQAMAEGHRLMPLLHHEDGDVPWSVDAGEGLGGALNATLPPIPEEHGEALVLGATTGGVAPPPPGSHAPPAGGGVST